MFDFIKNISSTEVIIVVLILVIIFGTRAMVKIGRTGGEAVKGLKKVKKDLTEAMEDDNNKPGQN